MADREFVSTTGTEDFVYLTGVQHRVGREKFGFVFAACDDGVCLDVENTLQPQPVKDCKRCYPKGRTE